MSYGEEVAVCSEINTEHINILWAQCEMLVHHLISRLFSYPFNFLTSSILFNSPSMHYI